MPYVTGTLGVISLFFLMTMAFGANPYERLDWIPPDGRGMAEQALAALAAMGEREDRLTATLDVRDDRIWLGPIPLAILLAMLSGAIL